MEVLQAVLLTLALVGVISLGAERATEAVKLIFIALVKLPVLSTLLAGWSGQPWFKWALSLVVAYGGVYGFSVDFFAQFDLFASLDPQLLQMLNVIVVWAMSNYIHDGEALPKVSSLVAA